MVAKTKPEKHEYSQDEIDELIDKGYEARVADKIILAPDEFQAEVERKAAEIIEKAGDPVKMKAITLAYDTRDDKLSQLTYLPKRFIFTLAAMDMFAARRKVGYVVGTLPEVFRISIYKHFRSLEGQHILKLRDIAEQETSTSGQEPPTGDASHWGGGQP